MAEQETTTTQTSTQRFTLSSDQKRFLGFAAVVVGLFLLAGIVFSAGARYGATNPPGQVFGIRREGPRAFFGQRGGMGRGMMGQATFGSITKVGTNTFDMQTNGGTTATVTLTATTVIIDNGAVVTISSLKAGQTVAVMGTTSGNQITATRVMVDPMADNDLK